MICKKLPQKQKNLNTYQCLGLFLPPLLLYSIIYSPFSGRGAAYCVILPASCKPENPVPALFDAIDWTHLSISQSTLPSARRIRANLLTWSSPGVKEVADELPNPKGFCLMPKALHISTLHRPTGRLFSSRVLHKTVTCCRRFLISLWWVQHLSLLWGDLYFLDPGPLAQWSICCMSKRSFIPHHCFLQLCLNCLWTHLITRLFIFMIYMPKWIH